MEKLIMNKSSGKAKLNLELSQFLYTLYTILGNEIFCTFP